jgi:ribonuclease HI
VFSQCIWAQQIWFASPLTIRFDNQNQTFNEWLEGNITNTPIQSLELICAICYHIWNARNLLIFQNKDIPVIEILRNTLDSLAEYKNQQQPTQASMHRTNQNRGNNAEIWKPPPRNSLKLNMDAHRLVGDGRWALGLILRMEDGKIVGARTKLVYGVDEAIEAEALGLDEVIEFATLYKDRKIIIEMDNSEVVKAIQRNRYPRRYWGQIARRGGDFIRANPSTSSIQWVRRTGNEAAHQMAKWAEVEPNKTWVDNYPPNCSPYPK